MFQVEPVLKSIVQEQTNKNQNQSESCMSLYVYVYLGCDIVTTIQFPFF